MNEEFIVTFYDEDRKTILDRQEVKIGDTVKYAGKQPEKPAENGIEYTFSGWQTTGNIANITENIDLFATYEQGSKKTMFELSEQNAQNANLNEVMQAGQKVSQVEEITRNMSSEEKSNLINQVKDKGFVDLDPQIETERD